MTVSPSATLATRAYCTTVFCTGAAAVVPASGVRRVEHGQGLESQAMPSPSASRPVRVAGRAVPEEERLGGGLGGEVPAVPVGDRAGRRGAEADQHARGDDEDEDEDRCGEVPSDEHVCGSPGMVRGQKGDPTGVRGAACGERRLLCPPAYGGPPPVVRRGAAADRGRRGNLGEEPRVVQGIGDDRELQPTRLQRAPPRRRLPPGLAAARGARPARGDRAARPGDRRRARSRPVCARCAPGRTSRAPSCGAPSRSSRSSSTSARPTCGRGTPSAGCWSGSRSTPTRCRTCGWPR